MNLFSRWCTIAPNLVFVRYVAASAAALCVDYATYWFVAYNEWLTLPQAAVAGYLMGLVVAYFLIRAGIFKNGWLKDRKLFEMLLFVTSGFLGTLMTYGTVKLYVVLIGPHMNQAKLAAIAVSFFSVYLYRKHVVFRSKAEIT